MWNKQRKWEEEKMLIKISSWQKSEKSIGILLQQFEEVMHLAEILEADWPGWLAPLLTGKASDICLRG